MHGEFTGRPLGGGSDQPIVEERWIAGGAMATQLNGRPCAVSAVTSLGDARLSTTDPVYMEANGNQPWFDNLRRGVRLTSCGGDGYAYGLLAGGLLDLVVEAGLAWHDAAALIPIVEGAGGAISDFRGRPLRPGGKNYEVIAAASRDLLEAALSLRPG